MLPFAARLFHTVQASFLVGNTAYVLIGIDRCAFAPVDNVSFDTLTSIWL
jgi:hypothetical protein